MFITADSLAGYKLNSLDGDIGKVREFYFDDHKWVVRYLVADTGTWLTDRQVLISPHALVSVNKNTEHIIIDLTKKQIEGSPSLDTHKPVSRQYESEYYGFYGWPVYWGGPNMWGPYAYPRFEPSRNGWRESTRDIETWDPYLRSTADVIDHDIQALDGAIGNVKGLVIDDETWAIRYLIVDTGNWWPGKKILVAPQWIERVSWNESMVFVNLTREAIKQSPEFTGESLLTRDYETRLHGHYNRHGYWVERPAGEASVR